MTTRPAALFGPTAIAAAAAAVYTAPANTTVVFTRIVVTNRTATAAQLTLWLVRSGGARANSNILLGATAGGQAIGAGPSEPYVVTPGAGLVLAPGDAIHAESDTSGALNIVGSGWTNT